MLAPTISISFLKFFGSAEDFFTKKSFALCNSVLQPPIFRRVFKAVLTIIKSRGIMNCKEMAVEYKKEVAR